MTGEPVAVVRAVPSMVRAGQAIRFDGSDSYAIDTGATITDYAFTFGDGANRCQWDRGVFQDHTFAQAGEFMATLIVTDSAGSVGPPLPSLVEMRLTTLVVHTDTIDQTVVVLTHTHSEFDIDANPRCSIS